MTSKIVVNNIEADAGISTVFFNSDIGATDGTLNVDGNLTVDGVITYEDVTNVDSVGIVTARSGIHVTGGSVGIGTDNPLRKLDILGTGRPVEIGSTNATNIVKLYNSATGKSTYNGVDIQSNSTAGGIISAYGGYLDLRTSSSNGSDATSRLQITGDGNIGIGTDTPTSFGPTLQVAGTDPALLLQDTATIVDYFGVNVTSGISQLWYDDAADLTINTASGLSGSGLSEKLRIKSNGYVGIGTENPGHVLDLYNSAGSDCLRLNVNGGAGGSNKQNAIRFSVDGDVKAHMGLAVDAGRLISGSIANDFCLKGLGANHILFATNSNERLGIRSDGAVTIGKASDMGSNYARLSIDCHGRNVIADTTDITKYGLAFHNDPTNDAANGIGFFNDDGSNCGGYILHHDKGSNNLGDLVFGTAESSNSPQERLRITANGRLIQKGFVTTSVHRRTSSIVAGTYTFGTVSDAFAGILYVTGTHNNGHSTRMYIINKSTNGTGVTLVGDGNNYNPARVDITLSGNNLQGQVYYGNRPVLQMITLRGSYTHTLAES
jgi:hypothetical protein